MTSKAARLAAGAGDPEIQIATALEPLRDAWAQRALESRNVFSTWEWASTWWRHVRPRGTPLVLACRRGGGELAALLPLYVWAERPLRIARFVGHGPADQLGPVCPPEERRTAAAALRRAVELLDVDLVLAELLDGGGPWRGLLGDRPLLQEASPTVVLDGGWDVYLAARSANFRQQVRRRERNLRRRYAVRFRLAETERLEEEMTLLCDLHRARWRDGGSPFLRWEPFHREFASLAAARGWLRLWFLELDDRPVAAWYGFRYAGVESYYQAGRDPALGDGSVGWVLLAHTIREAAADGMREYRLLRGGEAFKLRFADSDEGLDTYAIGRGARGRAARAAAAVALRSRGVRSIARRLAGPGRG